MEIKRRKEIDPRKRRKRLAIVVILVAMVIIIHGRAQKKESKNAPSRGTQTQGKGDKISAVDGEMVSADKVVRPFAIVVENHPDARPQSGLSQADIVYEALAEGGITRFLAVYQTQDVSSIGPIRSARTYFNRWAAELGAVYAHVGGNSDALDEIKSGISGVSDADQFFNDPYFTRIKSRVPPHNTYSSIEKLKALVEKHGYSSTPTYKLWNFKDEQPAEANASIPDVKVNFSTPSYAVVYKYDSKNNAYKRYLAGSPAVDAGNGQQIIAKNIVVQIVKNYPVQSDTLYAIGMDTQGAGDAYVFEDGKKIVGTWKFINGRTRYYDDQGKEVSFNRGKTWVEIVPPEFDDFK